jgi:inner membrane protein
MDTVTQIALGASVGHLVAGRTLGARACLYGAIGGLIPDLDIFLKSSEPLAEWKYHRGVTHSLWFGPVLGSFLGWAGWKLARWRRPDSPGAADNALKYWIALWVLAIFTHPLLDLFTVYGTQLLAPFSRARFAISGVPIIDPVYTLILIAGLAAIWRYGARTRSAARAGAIALALTTGYLFLGWAQNERAEKLARASLASQGVTGATINAYTTMFTIWQRRLVATTKDRHLIGYVSTLNPQPISWQVVTRNPNATNLVDAALSTPNGRAYRRFAVGPLYAHLEGSGTQQTLRLYDMRYGFPGKSLAGIWGVQWKINGAGPIPPISRFTNRPDASIDAVVQIFRAGFGLPNTFF